jgi:hypothetical protein
MTAAQLSEQLYQHDPMHTCCRENDCTDEYDGVAAAVMTLAEQGTPLPEALTSILAGYFGLEPEEVAPQVKQLMAGLTNQ